MSSSTASLPKAEADSLTESDFDESDDVVEEVFSRCSSSFTLKPSENDFLHSPNSEHIYSIPLPKLSSGHSPTSQSPKPLLTTSPAGNSKLPLPRMPELSKMCSQNSPSNSAMTINRRNTDTVLKTSPFRAGLASNPALVSKYGTNPRLVGAKELTYSPAEWPRNFGTFKKTESAIFSTNNELYLDETGHQMNLTADLAMAPHRNGEESFGLNERSAYLGYNSLKGCPVNELFGQPVQLLALHENGQLRPVSFLGHHDNKSMANNSAPFHASHLAEAESEQHNKIDKSKRPQSMINLETNATQKHLQILTKSYELEQDHNMADSAVESHETPCHNASPLSNGAPQLHHGSEQNSQDRPSDDSNHPESPNTSQQQPSTPNLNSTTSKTQFIEDVDDSSSASTTSMSCGTLKNPFEKNYKFQLNDAQEISWGSAEMSFGLQVTREHLVNKVYYYDFRVTFSEGARVDYLSPDRDFDFITTHFPLVEARWFQNALRRVFPTVVIPDAPPVANNQVETVCGTLALEIWLSWLGRHPVVGRSPIFWHMLRYTKSKDWQSQKALIQKVTKFTKTQPNSSLFEHSSQNPVLSNYRAFLQQERIHAETIEQKLVSLLSSVEHSLKQHSALVKSERLILRSIGEEIQNFSSVSKLRNPNKNHCSNSFSFVGQKLAACEEKMHSEWFDSTQKLRIQLQTILSAYRRLIHNLKSRSFRSYVKLFQSANKNSSIATKRPVDYNCAALTCYTSLAELNYLKLYEVDLVFTPAYQFVKEVQATFEDQSDELASAFDTIKF